MFKRHILILLALLLSVAPAFPLEADSQNIVLLGDSNTWIGGSDSDDERGWNYWLKTTLSPASLTNMARSGATWSHTEGTTADTAQYSEIITDNNVIFNQVLRLKAAVDSGVTPRPDIIIMWAGTNDAWFAHLRPDAFSRTPAYALALTAEEMFATPPGRMRSLAEAVALDIRLLQEAFPVAKIVVATPLPSVKIAPGMLRDVSDIIDTTASHLGASVVRMDLLSPIDPEREATTHRLTSDGTHTSPEGARANAAIICRFLQSMYY